MKKIFLFALIMATMTAVVLDSCGTKRVVTIDRGRKMVSIPDENANNDNFFTTPSLQHFVEQNQGASVVVRSPQMVTATAQSEGVDIAGLIERGLMKNFNPRDRALFETALNKMEDGSDYPAIRQKTGVDLIFEITQFKKEWYPVSRWYYEYDPQKTQIFNKTPQFRKDGKKKVLIPGSNGPWTWYIPGYSIEIKVIILADNLIAGTFKYYLQPTKLEFLGQHYDNALKQDIAYYRVDSGIMKDFQPSAGSSNGNDNSREESYSEKLSNYISKWIDNIVIPDMFDEMQTGQAGSRKLVGTDKSDYSNQANNDNQNPNEVNLTQEQNQSNNNNTRTVSEQPRPRQRPLSRDERNRQAQDKRKQDAADRANAQNEADATLAQNSQNSVDIAASIAEMVQKQDTSKYSTSSTDLARFDKLKNVDDISRYIISITSAVAYIPQENEEQAIVYVEKSRGADLSLLLFIDGKCVGVGTHNKGLLTKLPIDDYSGMHSLAWRYIDKGKTAKLADVPVNFSIKSNYIFSWNNNALMQKN